MREIITLQLGHLSNYTATHFWNAQESYFTYSDNEESWIDHNVHWRAGIGADGSETFLPRTVIYDLKGGFGSLRKINALYEPDSEPGQSAAMSSLWPRQSVVQKQTPIEPSAYQQSLDAGTKPPPLSHSSVRYWSDFSRVFHHPKSLVQLYDFELHSTIRPFERYEMGNELFETLDKDEDLLDRDFRPFAEESDQMQGIQVMTSLDDAWGGFATSYLDSLRDEYPKTCIWLWGLQSPTAGIPREKRQLRTSNLAQALARASSTASMIVPLTLPEARNLPQNVSVDPSSTWDVSAAFATAMETATLESRAAIRRDAQPATLWDMVEGLNTGGNQTLARMRMRAGSLASRENPDGGEFDLFGIGNPQVPSRKSDKGNVFGQLSSSHGVQEDKDEDEEENDPRTRRIVGETVYRRFDSPKKFPLLDSFPSIYTEGAGHPDIQVRTELSTESSIAPRIKNLKTMATWTIPLDEREALSNDLTEISDAYVGDWSEGSDEDDDDM